MPLLAVSEWHHREPRVSCRRHDARPKLRSNRCGASRERDLLDQARAARSCGRAGNRCPGRLEVHPFVASRSIRTRRLAHALDLPRDHPRTRQTLPERLDKTFPAESRNPHCRSSARLDPRALSRFESYGLAALAAATEQARRAATTGPPPLRISPSRRMIAITVTISIAFVPS